MEPNILSDCSQIIFFVNPEAAGRISPEPNKVEIPRIAAVMGRPDLSRAGVGRRDPALRCVASIEPATLVWLYLEVLARPGDGLSRVAREALAPICLEAKPLADCSTYGSAAASVHALSLIRCCGNVDKRCKTAAREQGRGASVPRPQYQTKEAAN
jgi:hypothetical protein